MILFINIHILEPMHLSNTANGKILVLIWLMIWLGYSWIDIDMDIDYLID
jgi:hypothetical protein